MLIFLKKSNLLLTIPIAFSVFINKALQLNNWKTRTDKIAEFLLFVICVEAIIKLLWNNLHDSTFKVLF